MIDVQTLPYSTRTAERIRPLVERCQHPILFDSGKPEAEQGRWDLFMADPLMTLQQIGSQVIKSENNKQSVLNQDFANALKNAIKASNLSSQPIDIEIPFIGGAAGLFDYEWGAANQVAGIKWPTNQSAFIGIYAWVFAQDHQTGAAYLITHDCITDHYKQMLLDTLSVLPQNATATATANDYKCSPFKNLVDKNDYTLAIGEIHEYIKAGDTYQINYTQPFKASFSGNAFDAWVRVRDRMKSPFCSYIDTGDRQVLSVSPERFIAISKDRTVDTRPIKGTAARSDNLDIDHQNAKSLLASAKDRAENLMIVDLLRNDIGKHCVAGSVKVPALFALQSFANVHHLVSTITGKLKPDTDPIDLVLDALPGGSITGAPKIRAMQLIEQLEQHPRGAYCGAIGYFSVDGQCDTNIAIRTLEIKDSQIIAAAGGGIVNDSVAEHEYAESLQKITKILKTIENY